MDETADDMQQVQDWLDGKVSWMEMSQHVRDAIDEVMLEESTMPDDEVEVPEEEPFTAEIVKSEETELLHKADAEHRFTLGPWYIPNRYDAHGEWTDADELQKALWEYVRSGDRGIRLQHNRDIVAGEWVEAMSFPTPVTIGMNKDANQKQVTYPAGTVFLGVQWKPWAWELVKAGKIQGFSIGGAAARIDMGMPDEMAKASFGGDRSAAGRYAAEQRWAQQSRVDQAVSRYRALGRMGIVGAGARVAEARRRKIEREEKGEKRPSIVDRIQRYFSEEYTNPKPLSQIEREEETAIRSRRSRASDRENRGSFDAIALGSGRTALISGGNITTTPFEGARVGRGSGYKGRLKKSVEEQKASIMVDARIDAFLKASFGGDRSAAGRYAANMRWWRLNRDRQIDLGGRGDMPMPQTKEGEALGFACKSLVTHCDLDAVAQTLKAKGITLDAPEAVDIVRGHLTAERRAMWDEKVNNILAGVPSHPERGSHVYVLGGGGGAGKSSSEKGGELPTYGKQIGKNPDMYEPRNAAMINADTIKEETHQYQAMQKGTEKDQEQAAGFVHEESSMIAAAATTCAIYLKKDAILDGTFDNGVEKSIGKLQTMRKLGATKIVGMFFSCDTDTAWERSEKRFKNAQAEGKPARRVPEEPLRNAHIKVSRNFEQYVASGQFDSISLTDTNGPQGSEFKMFTWDRKSGSRVLNPDAYKRFLDKQFESATPNAKPKG